MEQTAQQPCDRGQLLVVDDEPFLRDAVAASLRFLGFDVTTAFNANAGGSLGIRLQAISEPGQTSYTFGNFALTTAAAPVPEPGTLLMLGTGLAAAAVRLRRLKDRT